MGNDRRTEIEMEHRRGGVAKLYLEGNSLRQIAGRLGCSHQTVKLDMDFMYGEWQQERKPTFDEAVTKELRKLDKLESQAWDGWERSCRDAEKTIEENGVTEKGDFIKSRKEVAPQAGDPRFLQVILQAMQRRCTILGIDAPKKIEDVTPTRTIEIQVTTPSEVQSVTEFMQSYGGRN